MVSKNEAVVVQYYGKGPGDGEFLVALNGIRDGEDLQVWRSSGGDDTLATAGTDYTVAVTASGVVVTFSNPPATTELVTFRRALPVGSELNLSYNERLPSVSLENQFDRLARMIRDQESGTLKLSYPISEEREALDPSPDTLPPREARKSTVWYFDDTGKLTWISAGTLLSLMDATITINAAALADATSYGRDILTAASAEAQRTFLGLGTAALRADNYFVVTTDFATTFASTQAAATVITGSGITANTRFTLVESGTSKAIASPSLKAWIFAEVAAKTSWTLAGQLELSAGQAATNATSAMSRALHDARIATKVGERLSSVLTTTVTNNTTTLASGLAGPSLTLPPGTYEVTGGLWATNGAAASGLKCKVAFTGGTYTQYAGRSMMWTGTTPPAAGGMTTVNFLSAETSMASAASPAREVRGILLVEAETVLQWQFAQNSGGVSGNSTTAQPGTYLCARRLS